MPPKKVPYFKPGKELKDLINTTGTPGHDGAPGPAEARDDDGAPPAAG